MTGDGPFDGTGQVMEQMPAVGDPDRQGCSALAALGVASGAISADRLDAGMGLQPRSDRRG
nr:hypothetical protein [Actinomadura mexicana]